MTGVIEGGWEFVWAAYGLTALILLAYGASVLARLKAETGRSSRRPSPPGTAPSTRDQTIDHQEGSA